MRSEPRVVKHRPDMHFETLDSLFLYEFMVQLQEVKMYSLIERYVRTYNKQVISTRFSLKELVASESSERDISCE